MKALYALLIAALSVLCLEPRLHAMGFGVYGSGGLGPLTIPATKINSSSRQDRVGFGFVFDTVLARDELVGYRLNAGYDNYVSGGSRLFGPGAAHRAVLTNTFTMGVARKKYVRFWMGPQVEFACLYADRKGPLKLKMAYPLMTGFFSPYSTGMTFVAQDISYVIPSMGFGGAMGLNINAGKSFTIAVETGIQTAMGLGPHSYTERTCLLHYPGTANQVFLPWRRTNNSYYEYFGLDISAKVSVMYRVGDVYERKDDGPDEDKDADKKDRKEEKDRNPILFVP